MAVGLKRSRDEGDASWQDGTTTACTLRFMNQSQQAANVFWVDFDGKEVKYHQLLPGAAHPQRTYTTHPWRLRWAEGGGLIGTYVGETAQVEVNLQGELVVSALKAAKSEQRKEWGTYGRRGVALRSIEVWAYECVCPEAVKRAVHLVTRMLGDSPPAVVKRLAEAGTRVAIIGRNQVTTDIPEHEFLKWSEGGRNYDTTTRGLGGTVNEPLTSCGEENLTMQDDRHYPSENILIHEFGHTVMNVGLSDAQRARINQLYKQAHASGKYNTSVYMMENADEYWAEGTQAWFEATIRTDVTDGVTTRAALRARDPGLAEVMQEAYGDGAWRFHHDAPAPLRHKPQPQQQQAQAQPRSGTSGAASSTTSKPTSSALSAAEDPEGGVAQPAVLSAPQGADEMDRERPPLMGLLRSEIDARGGSGGGSGPCSGAASGAALRGSGSGSPSSLLLACFGVREWQACNCLIGVDMNEDGAVDVMPVPPAAVVMSAAAGGGSAGSGLQPVAGMLRAAQRMLGRPAALADDVVAAKQS